MKTIAQALALALAGCMAGPVTDGGSDKGLSAEDGPSLFRPGNRFTAAEESDRYYDEVQPLLAQRCVTCHGCTDSPCQLKLTSFEGVARGASETNLFDPTRIVTRPAPHRFSDHRVIDTEGALDLAQTEANWRSAGYYSVTEGQESSIMSRLLEEARANPIMSRDLTPALELRSNVLPTRTFECTGGRVLTAWQLAARAMPMGLEQLSEEQHEVFASWLREGAPGPSREAELARQKPSNPDTVARWERFLNQDSSKGRLVSRYLYEHLFFAHLHFPDAPGEFFELVRSQTPPGEPIAEIVTEVPHDIPDRKDHAVFYYRLRKLTSIIVAKNHVPWELNDAVMNRWTELFFGDYEVRGSLRDEHNPFENFHQIPATSRARFFLENSFQFVEAMVKADVCTGTGATYAIRDRFWVWFLDPEADPSAQDPRLGHSNYLHLNPTGFDLEERYQESFEASLRRLRPDGLSMNDLWDGDGGSNPNAWLTVLRHERSTTVHHGAVAGRPDTLWVLSYSNFERLYYNLVVNFNVRDRFSAQAGTWKYMSRVRTEGEDLWISLLPDHTRTATRMDWSKDFGSGFFDTIQSWIEGDLFSAGRPTRVIVGTLDPVGDVIAQMRDRVGPTVTGGADPLAGPSERPAQVNSFDEFEQAAGALTGWQGPHAQHFPNVTVLRVSDGTQTRVYTVVNNRGYASHDLISGAGRSRRPELDVLSAVRGLAGNYPELFIDVQLGAGATELTSDLAAVVTADDWQAVMAKYASGERGVHIIARTDPALWRFLDWLHDWDVRNNPITAGILDLSEYSWH